MIKKLIVTIQKPKLISNIWIWVSFLVGILVVVVSLFGILNEKTYSRETNAWALQAIGQDYANLIVIVILGFSTYFITKRSFRAYLVWLGTYLYMTYAFAIYAFSVHFQFLFLIYVIILGLSFYTLAINLLKINQVNFQKAFLQNSKSKIFSGFLMLIVTMFSFLWLSEILPNILLDTVPISIVQTQLLVNPVHVLDLAFLLPAMFITSVLLWRKNIWGYILAVPMLIFTVTMGLGIIAIFIISCTQGQPFSPIPAIAVSLVVILSAYFSYLFLREVPQSLS